MKIFFLVVFCLLVPFCSPEIQAALASPLPKNSPTPSSSPNPNTNITTNNTTPSPPTSFGEFQCVVVGDYYIQYRFDKDTKQVQVVPSICDFASESGNYDGYAAISMHKRDGVIKNASFIVVAWLSNQCKDNSSTSCTHVRQLRSHEDPTLKENGDVTPGLVVPDPKGFSNVKFDEYYTFDLFIDQKLLTEFPYVTVACSKSKVIENGTTEFPKHQKVITKYLDLTKTNATNYCDISLASAQNMSDSSITMWFVEMSAALIIFMILVLCRDLQPLKSQYLAKNSKGVYFKVIGVLSKITTPEFTLTIVAVFLFALGLIDFIIIVSLNPTLKCTGTISDALSMFHFSFNCICTTALIIIGISDIVVNIVRFIQKSVKTKFENFFKNLGKLIYDFYMFSDPFYFRLEQIVVIFVFVLYVTTEIFSFDNVFNSKTAEYTYYIKRVVLYSRTVVKYLFVCYQVIIPLGLSLIILIKNFILKCVTRKNGNLTLNDLQIVLASDILSPLFFEFSKQEWSQENLLCYRDIDAYKKISKIEKKKEFALEIFDKYLSGTDAPLEINIDQRQCIALKKDMQSCEDDSIFDNELFAKVEQTVQVNLSDTLSRFIISPVYVNYERNTQYLQKELAQKQSLVRE
eukprot:gene504-8018_t